MGIRTTDETFLSTQPLGSTISEASILLPTAGHPGLGPPPTSVNYVNTVVQITSWTLRSWNEPLNSSDCKPQVDHPSHQTGSLASSDLLSLHHHTVLPCCQVSTADATSFLSLSGSHNKSLDVALGTSINLPQSLVPCLPTNSPLDSIYSITNGLTPGLLAHLDMTQSCQLALLQTSDL